VEAFGDELGIRDLRLVFFFVGKFFISKILVGGGFLGGRLGFAGALAVGEIREPSGGG